MSDELPEPVNAGTSGPHFCEWCLEHWQVYDAMGGACSVMKLLPLNLRADGPVEVQAEIPTSFCNALGIVHGGASSMLLDEVGGLAVCCHVGFRYLRGTRHLKVDFLKRATPGPVAVRATVLEREETAVLVEIEITQHGDAVARATGNYAIYAPGKAKLPQQVINAS